MITNFEDHQDPEYNRVAELEEQLAVYKKKYADEKWKRKEFENAVYALASDSYMEGIHALEDLYKCGLLDMEYIEQYDIKADLMESIEERGLP